MGGGLNIAATITNLRYACLLNSQSHNDIMHHVMQTLTALGLCLGAILTSSALAQLPPSWVFGPINPPRGGTGGSTWTNVPKDLAFGGAYGFINNGVLVPNPVTGQASCPAGYTNTNVYGTYGTDYAVHICSKPMSATEPPILDFGGMYGFVEKSPSVNPATQQSSCPAGYLAQQLLGTYNVDYSLHICYRKHNGEKPALMFGGILGTVAGQRRSQDFDLFYSCSYGFDQKLIQGSYNVDWPLSLCYRRPS